MDEVVKPKGRKISDVVVSQDRRQRRILTRAIVVETALQVIDDEGLEALSMRALADRLGVTPRALYRHVADKDDLLRGVANLILGEVTLSPHSQSWRETLLQLGTELRRALIRHPHAAPLYARRMSVFPAVIAIADVIVDALTTIGVPGEDAVRTGHVLFNYTLGFVLAEAPYRTGAEPPGPYDPFMGIEPAAAASARREAPFLTRFTNDGLFASDEQYAFGLSLIVDSLAGHAAHPAESGTGAPAD